MPCYDNRDAYVTRDLKQEVDRLRDRNHELTRLLCLVCQGWQSDENVEELPPEVQTWWDAHQRMDAQRQETEQAAASSPMDTRIAQLEQERVRINAEIDSIRRGGL